jgi:hypothetical protein
MSGRRSGGRRERNDEVNVLMLATLSYYVS